MKKRMKGLISWWLVFAMLFSSVSVSFAAETGEVQSTYARYYKGSEALKLYDNVWISNTSAIYALNYGEGADTLTSQVSSLEEENRSENKILVGWNLWAKHNSGDLNAGPIEKSLTEVVTEDDITFCENNDSNYHDPLIEPRYVDKYIIDPPPTNETFTVGGKVYDIDSNDYIETDKVSYQWYGFSAQTYTVVGGGNSGDGFIEGDIDQGTCSDDGIWSDDSRIVVYFPTEAGDVVKVTPITSGSSAGLNATVIGYDGEEHNYTLNDGIYYHENDVDETDYGLLMTNFAEGVTFKIEVIRYDETALLEGQTDEILNTNDLDYGKYFCRLTFDEAGENIVLDSEEVEFAYIAPPHIHPICGAEHTDIGDHTGSCEDITWTAWEETDYLPEETGNYYLTSDVEIDNSWFPADGTVLCLNGYSIIELEDCNVIETYGEFTLSDCKKTGKITRAAGTSGGGIEVNFHPLDMYGGIICGHSEYIGGGIVIFETEFNMYGGEISGNNAEREGGGVFHGIYCRAAPAFQSRWRRAALRPVAGLSAAECGRTHNHRTGHNLEAPLSR